ncbi:4632_t:CDS:2 [Paraglomus brasilianum]|uniref:4632_t:CDS:1 n=1 Tax=Paraglomus brasilianum TaxID=144538 RepID=A0A9N9G340_9GLOM|nr:4632_t:CDS:2 [Paraglomus brasilianum]
MRCGQVESKSVLARVNITPYFIDGLQWKVWLIATCDLGIDLPR